jgi:hypothetical protein
MVTWPEKIVSMLKFNLTDTSNKISKCQIRLELIQFLMYIKDFESFHKKALYELKL